MNRSAEQVVIVITAPDGTVIEKLVRDIVNPDPAVLAARQRWERKGEELAALGPTGAAEASALFVAAVVAADGYGMETMLPTLLATGAGGDAFRQLLTLTHISDATRATFLGFRVSSGSRIRPCVGDDILLTDVLRHLLPPYRGADTLLYRGESARNAEQGAFGVGWTPSLDKAQQFARRMDESSVVLQTLAPGAAILAPPTVHSEQLQEFEYIVDRRRLTEVIVLERYYR